MIASNGPSPPSGSSRSPSRKSMRSATPSRAALAFATASARSLISIATKCAPWLLVRRRDRQAARAGPDVDASRRLELAGHGQVLGDDEFRLRARDQHIGRNRECQREKLLAAHEVSHRCTRRRA